MKVKVLFHILFLSAIGSIMSACTSTNREELIESKELYRIQVGGKCGFINEKGKLVIEPQFDETYWFFGDSVCYAKIGERKGLINTNGEYVVELDKSIVWVYRFNNGVASYRTENGKEGIINKSGEIVLPAIYKKVWSDNANGFVIEDTLGNRGYVNAQGDFIVPCRYDAVNGFNEGLMVVATSNKCGYVDSTGVWVIDSIYDDARAFGNGLARVRLNDKWRFIDNSGNVVESLIYDDILTGFASNRALINHGNIIELINTKGDKIATIDADSVNGFRNGYATFQKYGKYGIIDTTGAVVIPAKFEKLSQAHKGCFVFEKNKKQGVVDVEGKVIVEPKHETVTIEEDLSLIVCIDDNGERGTYYDRDGNLIWKDMQGNKFSWPEKPTKEDFVRYFDSRLPDLDPIEGIYYVTFNSMAIDRENDHASSNGSKSTFYAVIRTPGTDEFLAYTIDENKPWGYWVKKFVQIGESNTYAVVKSGESSWADDGKMILEDPYKFEITLRQGGNSYYNWYVKCDFVKDYPSALVYEQVQKAEWTGTGFAIADGYVATNYHVINGAKTIMIKGVNGDLSNTFKGYVIASDREHDLAIVQIVDKKFSGFDDIPYCLGKSVPEVGDDIFVLGYPMTQTMGNEVKLTDGIISAASGYKGDNSMYQISAAVQPGNSGGPLFDNKGNVVGIICAKHADAENANYAIKISYLLSLIKSSDIGIKLPKTNNIESKSLSKKVKQVEPFVYIIECISH